MIILDIRILGEKVSTHIIEQEADKCSDNIHSTEVNPQPAKILQSCHRAEVQEGTLLNQIAKMMKHNHVNMAI